MDTEYESRLDFVLSETGRFIGKALQNGGHRKPSHAALVVVLAPVFAGEMLIDSFYNGRSENGRFVYDC